MERVLLVEPEYTNKYPPIGLMKIATYHRNKNDRVEFYKGKAPYTVISKADRIYITTLFTFYYDITIETIKHYMKYMNPDRIFVGGIAATLLYDNFKKDTGLKNVLVGQLTNSSMIGYDDNINIDNLPLDYDILDDISYKYPAGDNFFVYTTRGCPRKCNFCAVSILEPEFKETNNLIVQIQEIREKYGDKRNILIMDNNILYSDNLKEIANDLLALGFKRDNPNYIYPNPLELLLNKIERRKKYGISFDKQEEEVVDLLFGFKTRVAGKENYGIFQNILDDIISCTNKYETINNHKDKLIELVEKYRYKTPLQRFVDFNQGVDARLLSEEKMQLLTDVSIKPFRLAYDDVAQTDTYFRAFQIAYKYGVRHFSNYILYNYKDSPKDLWNRLYNTIIMYDGKNDIQAFSFPMKYAPIDETGRDFIGTKWNKKYLAAINIILNVTNGVVAKEKDFFFRAYGKSAEEFLEILTMPNEFIKFRAFFEAKGYIKVWKEQFDNLNHNEKQGLLKTLCGQSLAEGIMSKNVSEILRLYKITKHMASKENNQKNITLEL